MKLLTVSTDTNDVPPVLNFGIISLALVLFEWRCCYYTSEVRATVILLLRLLTAINSGEPCNTCAAGSPTAQKVIPVPLVLQL